MKKFRCTVCGYVYEGDAAPEKCPLCKAPASKFVEVEEATADGPLVFADEHVIGVAKGCDDEMIKQPLHGRMYRSWYVLGNEPPGRP